MKFLALGFVASSLDDHSNLPELTSVIPLTNLSRGKVVFKEISLACALVMFAPALATAQTNWTWHKTLAAGRTIEIKNISGDISATPASGSEVEVIARRHGSGSEARINVEEHAYGVTICTLYDSGEDCQDLNGSRHDRWHDGDNQDVDFEIRVPRGVVFEGHSVTGDVTATNLTADVDAGSVSGSVRVATSGIAHASSVSGSVHARIGRNDWNDLAFSTVSGNIVLELPADLNTDVKFNTLSGNFDSDWPITITSSSRNRYGPRDGLRGTIGSGGRQLSVSTVSGSLELHKAR